jgi:tRNA threonylcarbamoyladenosine biosynthesis protein TsaB
MSNPFDLRVARRGKNVEEPLSIAIETSCRRGGVALGAGEELLAWLGFDASARHGVQLVARLSQLLASAQLRPADIDEVYVSVGPGSFTGTRIGVTVARTLAQVAEHVRCVAVSSPAAVAEGARGLCWQELAVVLDARRGLIHATRFARRGGDEQIVQRGEGAVVAPAAFLADAPRPLTLLGEGLGYHDLRGEGVTVPPPHSADAPPHLPDARAVWRVGRRLARSGRFTPPARLLPLYSRKPEAVRLWERRAGVDPRPAGGDNEDTSQRKDAP